MSSWKRKKWLLKNLTFFQLVKYFLTSKPMVLKEELVEYDITSYEVDSNIEIDSMGTILIKPSGIGCIQKIILELNRKNISITKCVKINNYRKYAHSVFYMVSLEEQNIWFTILNKYYMETSNIAILLYLNKEIDKIGKLKQGIRKRIGIDFFRVERGGNSYITSLTPIHSSNKKERIFEENVIQKMLIENEAELITPNVFMG